MRILSAALAVLLCSLSSFSQAETIRLTIYSDGLSCPANCDSHVVFQDALNGTEFAHKPGTNTGKCIRGEKCRICIESGGQQCLEVMYRGTGPGKKTFDFTPAFYKETCVSTPNQPALATKCFELKRAAKNFEDRINCIADPENAKCKQIIASANAKRELDLPKFKECLAVGEKTFNKDKANPEKRTHSCAYELIGTGGPNSKGTTWKKLLPGACRAGTFVGRDGLDCCSGYIFEDGPMDLECRGFYPAR